MDYINSVTLQIKTLREVCAEAGASIPAGQVYGDWFPILPSAPPVAGDGQIVEPSAPVKKAGKWYMGWSVREMTPAELEQRNAQTIAEYTAFLEGKFDAAAISKRYDNRLTCALRAAYPGPFQAEGAAFGSWMDECNAIAYALLLKVMAGEAEAPTTEQLWAMMPEIVWPS